MAAGQLVPPNQEDLLLGKIVSDRYRVIKKLGEGGMGAVYLAEHVFIEKKVALKVLAPELARKADLTARFLQEAKSASRINHENVIDISDFGQSPEGFVYFAMEYLQGQDLGQAVRAEGALSWRRARPIILQICAALGAAHSRGIVHRDMKPENVFLIDKAGRKDFVKLLDFGIAKVQSPDGEGPKLTQTGMIFGTPEYMAPEQAEGKVCDQRADIYAVGCVMHHLLAGEPPFTADSFVAMLTKHLLEPAKPPSHGRPQLGITADMDSLVLKALSKHPDQRYQTMAEVMAAVEAIAESAGNASSAGARPPGKGVSATRPLGGSDAQPIIATSGRVSNTELLTVGGASEDTSVHERDTHLSGGPKKAPIVLITIGLALGAAVAAAWLLLGRSSVSDPVPPASPEVILHVPTAAPAPAAPVAPTAHPAPTGQPAPTAAPAAAAPTATEAARPTRPRTRDESTRKHSAPDNAADKPPGRVAAPESRPSVTTPAELKGFPGE